MDEVYTGHNQSIHPKLSRMPSEIVRDQVHCSFQNDPGCMLTLKSMPVESFVVATDYPHSEGTFPLLSKIVDDVMSSENATVDQKRALLGFTAARMFKTSPELVAAEKRALAAV